VPDHGFGVAHERRKSSPERGCIADESRTCRGGVASTMAAGVGSSANGGVISGKFQVYLEQTSRQISANLPLARDERRHDASGGARGLDQTEVARALPLAAGRTRHERRCGGVCHARAGAVEKVEPAGKSMTRYDRQDSQDALASRPRGREAEAKRTVLGGSRKAQEGLARVWVCRAALAVSRLHLGCISAVSRPVCSGSGACTSEQLPSPTATATAPHVAARCSPSAATRRGKRAIWTRIVQAAP